MTRRKKGGRPPNTPRYVDPKSLPELRAALQRQVSNMRRSALAFDEGHQEEAERLASSVHILCHDNERNIQSVLSRLQLRDTLWVPETSSLKPPPTAWSVSFGPPILAIWKSDQGVSYRAPLGHDLAKMRSVIFKRWWEQTVYDSEKPGLRLSRKNLVLSLRDQDGGGHVDGALTDEAYSRYSKLGDHAAWNSEGTFFGRAALGTQNLHWLTMRQIAWELDHALTAAGIE
jgi:hypothetical protein